MNNSFQIFERSNKIFNPTKGNILFIVMLTFVILLAEFEITYLKIPTILLMIACFFYYITTSTRIKPLSGKYTGTLIFNENNVTINGRKIETSEIKKIYLRTDDYEGRERSNRYIRSMSNGTNNLLDLTLTSGEVIKMFFKIEFMQHESLKPFVASLVKNNLMTFEKALGILKIDDDSLITRFKNELNKKELE